MNFRALTLGFLLTVFSAFFATNAFAEPSQSGVDIRVSATVPIVGFSTTVESSNSWSTYEDKYDYDEWMVGFNGRLSVGYRFSVIGIYLDQDLAWVKYNNEKNKDLDPYFLGGTYLTFRFLGVFNNLEFDLGLGLGAMYSNGDDLKAHTTHPAITVDSDGNASPCFALKLAIEMTYFFTDHIGIGIDLDYAIGMSFLSYHDDGYRVSQTDYIHHFTPGLHVRYAF